MTKLEVVVKVKPIEDGRYSATIYDTFYATGDTKKDAVKKVVALLEKELSYR